MFLHEPRHVTTVGNLADCDVYNDTLVSPCDRSGFIYTESGVATVLAPDLRVGVEL